MVFCDIIMKSNVARIEQVAFHREFKGWGGRPTRRQTEALLVIGTLLLYIISVPPHLIVFLSKEICLFLVVRIQSLHLIANRTQFHQRRLRHHLVTFRLQQFVKFIRAATLAF